MRSQVSGCRLQGKRGQMFSFILAFITVVMCFVSISLYLHQQDRVQGALVSPLVVLEVRDNLDIFEMREKELIGNVLKDMGSSFGTEEFKVEFREKFFEGITPEMKGFIFYNLTWNGAVLEGEFDRDSFLRNVLYPESGVYFEGGYMSFKRVKVGKRFDLEPEKYAQVTFGVGFDFDFDREYLIDKNGNVELVE